MLKLRALDGGTWRDLAGPYSLDVAVRFLGVLGPRHGRDRIAIAAA